MNLVRNDALFGVRFTTSAWLSATAIGGERKERGVTFVETIIGTAVVAIGIAGVIVIARTVVGAIARAVVGIVISENASWCSGDLIEVRVMEGDLIVVGTDGMLDNMFPPEIEEIIKTG
ncbi:hypothetical protein L484_017062 [Morus notabilis]|uniref:Uncharacterized protein n=1 Tax=Morus notabilis TaxID=981085 RepID=W9RUB1_9ROSA|nr:hypothetical protein L484_017062 [Morus notabilis]